MEIHRSMSMYKAGLASLGVDAQSIETNSNRFKEKTEAILEKRDCPRKEAKLNKIKNLCVTVFDASIQIGNQIDKRA